MNGRRDWRGPVAFVLAAGVSIALVAGLLSAELTNGPVTAEEISLLSTLGGAAIGAVATYLGMRYNGRDHGDGDGDDQTVERKPRAEDDKDDEDDHHAP